MNLSFSKVSSKAQLFQGYYFFVNLICSKNCITQHKISYLKVKIVPIISFFRLQICLFHAFSSPVKTCRVISSDPLPLCRIAFEAYHALAQDSYQKMALFIGASNSLLNPVIYGFWYREFRLRFTKAWRQLFKKICCCFYRENII